MARLRYSYIILLFFIFSCSVEKFNLSPVGTSTISLDTNNTESINYSFDDKKSLILYSSEITNLLASFPKFNNEEVNKEIATMKYYLKDYIGAMEAYNINGLNSSQKEFKHSYKKLQRLRKNLSKDEDQVLNRYLVKIKTNMSLLESNVSKDSLSIH